LRQKERGKIGMGTRIICYTEILDLKKALACNEKIKRKLRKVAQNNNLRAYKQDKNTTK